MSTSKYDFIIVNLKVIAQIPRDRRLRITGKGYFTIEDDHVLVPLKRTVFGDGRQKLIRDVDFLLDEVQSQIKLLLSSRYLEAGEDDDDKRATSTKIVAIYKELDRSILGFNNLKSTYDSDKLMVGKLELIIDKVQKFMNDIEMKVPNVRENISLVMIDKDTSINENTA